MRPTIDIDDDVRERVEQYALANGLLKPRAYGELIEAGLDAEEGGDEPEIEE